MPKVELVIPKGNVKPLVVGDKIFRSAYDIEVTEADLKQAYTELGETERLRNRSLEELKKKLSVNSDALNNLSLLRFQRYNKFNVEKAFNMMRKLSEKRTDYEELFQFQPNLEKLLDSNFLRYIPYRNEEGSPLFWLQFKRLNVDDISPKDVLNLVTIIGDLQTMLPSFQINSLLEIWDVGEITARHYSMFLSVTTLKLMLKFLLDTFPWRFKRIIFINCNLVVKTAFNAVRFLLKKKVADRVIFLGSDLNELHQYLNPALYPKEYGGNIEDHEFSLKEFINVNVPFLKYQRSIKLGG